MSATQLYPVISVPGTNFTEVLAGASAFGTAPFVGTAINKLYGVPPIQARRFLIRAIGYTCVVGAGLEFDFFADAAGTKFLSRFQFAAANGAQYNAAGLFNYYVDGLAIPYYDLDTINTVNPPTLHVGVQNVDTVAKPAGAAGAIVATFYLEPMMMVQG